MGAHNGACGRPRRKRAAPCRTQRSAKARCLEEDHRQVGEQLLVRGVFHRQHRASTVDAVAHRIGVLAEALSRRVRVTAASHVDPQALDEIASEAASRSRLAAQARSSSQPFCRATRKASGPSMSHETAEWPILFAASPHPRASTMAPSAQSVPNTSESPAAQCPPKPAISTSISPASRDSKSSATRRAKRRCADGSQQRRALTAS